MKINSNYTKKHQGFAMLEVVLAVVIIAIASFGIYKLYDSSSNTSKLNDEQNTISQIYSAATQMSYTLGSPPTAGQLGDSGTLPSSMWIDQKPATGTAPSGTFGGAFGTITYTVTGTDATYASIVATNIPGSVLTQFCSSLLSLGDVYVNSTAYDSKTIVTPKSVYSVTLYFPKGKKS